MADGHHFEKTVKSLYLCNRLTDFDKIWYNDAYWPLTADRPLKFRIFENPKWRPSAILDLLGAYWDHHHDHLMVSIVVQNLVEIDAVVSITWNFQYFSRLAWKRLFTPQKFGFSEDFTPKMGSNVNETPKRHILARDRVVWAIKRENPSSRLTCRWVDEKKV